MGFSHVAAFAIIGVSTLMAIEILTGSILPMINDIDDSYNDMKDRLVDQIQTDINITGVSISGSGPNYDHNITVENIGSVTLNTSDFTVLIDGTTQQFTCSSSCLYPEQNVYFNVTDVAGTGTKRLKVITENGVSDYYTYTVS